MKVVIASLFGILGFGYVVSGVHAQVADGCKVMGCSRQVCANVDAEDVVTTCEFSEANGCYDRFSECVMDESGQCGWSENAELSMCLAMAEDSGETGVNLYKEMPDTKALIKQAKGDLCVGIFCNVENLEPTVTVAPTEMPIPSAAPTVEERSNSIVSNSPFSARWSELLNRYSTPTPTPTPGLFVSQRVNERSTEYYRSYNSSEEVHVSSQRSTPRTLFGRLRSWFW